MANNTITRIGNQMESHKNRPLGVTIIAVPDSDRWNNFSC